MAETIAPIQRAPRRRWASAEKRRIVELTLHAGASVGAVAREHGVNPNNLRRWKALYRAEQFDSQANSASHVAGRATSATFVPVNVVHSVRRQQLATRSDSPTGGSCVMQLVFATGATLRILPGSREGSGPSLRDGPHREDA